MAKQCIEADGATWLRLGSWALVFALLNLPMCIVGVVSLAAVSLNPSPFVRLVGAGVSAISPVSLCTFAWICGRRVVSAAYEAEDSSLLSAGAKLRLYAAIGLLPALYWSACMGAVIQRIAIDTGIFPGLRA